MLQLGKVKEEILQVVKFYKLLNFGTKTGKEGGAIEGAVIGTGEVERTRTRIGEIREGRARTGPAKEATTWTG